MEFCNSQLWAVARLPSGSSLPALGLHAWLWGPKTLACPGPQKQTKEQESGTLGWGGASYLPVSNPPTSPPDPHPAVLVGTAPSQGLALRAFVMHASSSSYASKVGPAPSPHLTGS